MMKLKTLMESKIPLNILLIMLLIMEHAQKVLYFPIMNSIFKKQNCYENN